MGNNTKCTINCDHNINGECTAIAPVKGIVCQKFVNHEKPPIGLMPECVYEYNRIKNLSSKINCWVHDGHIGGSNTKTLLKWCDELSRRIKHYNEKRGL